MSVFLIGGSARTGKTTLYRRIRINFDGDCLDYDPLRLAMQVWADAKPGHPLMIVPSVSDAHFHDSNPIIAEQKKQAWVTELKLRDRAIWDGLEAYISDHQTNHGGDLLLVGAFWPSYVANLPATIDTRLITIVDTGADRADRLIRIARSESKSNNWQSEWSDEKIRTWCEFDRVRSKSLKAESTLHPCIDLADYTGDDATVFQQAQNDAATILGFSD